MSQPLPTSKFKWVEIDLDQISDLVTSKIKGYLQEVDVVKKLVLNLRDKKNYIIHIRVLDQALRHGLLLERIHKAIEFNQTDWMKPYLDFNTKLRPAAINNFEKDFFKLMNNSEKLWRTSGNIET